MKRRLIINDILLVIAIIGISTVYGLFLYSQPDTASTKLTVSYNNEFYAEYDLSNNFNGYIADTGVHFIINDGIAYIEASDCPDKQCTKMKPIDENSSKNQSIVCLPNRLVITKSEITENKEADVIAG